jgi:serine/threonine-protein kinase
MPMAAAPSVRTHPVGTIIANRYEVTGYLGRGGYGEVYKVIDRHQNIAVALKLLGTFAGTNMWAEAQVLTQLRSPYILEVRNADIEAGVPFLVTELAAHGSANAPMQPIGVPINRAVRWMRGACRGAARTHDEGLLHRDIKPANLFLTASDDARLGDFGIAALMNVSREAPPAGTPTTIAPEVAQGANTSIRSDVYSLGATLYALLAGRYAHQSATSVISDQPSPLRDLAPHVPQALAQRVSTAMARTPADRYQSPADFDAALGALPAVDRRWRRTDEHAPHHACWRGEASGKADATVCLVSVGTRWEVVGQHQPTGRRISAACRPPAPQSVVPRNLRAAMAAVP